MRPRSIDGDRGDKETIATRSVILGALLVGIVCFVAPALSWFHAVPGDLGDARLNSLFLEHIYRWLTASDASLFSPAYWYPFPDGFLLGDTLFGSAPAYVLARVGGLDRAGAFATWYAVGLIANYVAAAFVLRRMGFGAAAVAIGAFVFAFSLPIAAQDIHAQLAHRWAIPPALLAGLQFVQTGRRDAASRAVAWTAMQWLCSIYLGYFLILLLCATAGATWMRDGWSAVRQRIVHGWRERQDRRGLRLATLGAVLLAALLTVLHGLATHRLAVVPGLDHSDLLPHLSSYLRSDRTPHGRWIEQLLPLLPDTAVPVEQQLFVGVVPLMLIAVGIASWRRERTMMGGTVTTVLLASGLVMLATMQVGGFALYPALTVVPGVSAIRAVSRVVAVLVLPLGILAAVGVTAALQGRRSATLLAWLFVTALGAEVGSARHVTFSRAELRARSQRLDVLVPSALPVDAILFAVAQDGAPLAVVEVDGMELGQRHGRATLNGYAGARPPGVGTSLTCADADRRVNAWARWAGVSPDSAARIRQRVVFVPSAACP